MGAHFDQKKLQLARDPTILGVTYNLIEMTLEIKESRKKDLLEEMDSILESKLLDPGTAGKLKGKLMFGASQLWGKVGIGHSYVPSRKGSMPGLLFKTGSNLIKHWKCLFDIGRS